MSRVSNTTKKWFDLALKTASLSDVRGYNHGVVIVANSRPLVLGVNKMCSHPLFSPWSQHAEFDAIIRAGIDNLTTKKTTLYSARVGADGRALMSKPCSHCMEWIRKARIRKVVWWDRDTQRIEIANTKDLLV